MSGHVRMPKLRRAGGLKPLLPKDVSKWMKVVQVESAVNSPWSRNGCGWIFVDWDYFHWVFLWCTTGKMKLMAFLSSDSFVPTFLLSTLEFQFGLELGGKQRKLLVFDQVLWKQRWNPQKKAWACCVSPCLSLYSTSAVSVPYVCLGGYINCHMLKLHHGVQPSMLAISSPGNDHVCWGILAGPKCQIHPLF